MISWSLSFSAITLASPRFSQNHLSRCLIIKTSGFYLIRFNNCYLICLHHPCYQLNRCMYLYLPFPTSRIMGLFSIFLLFALTLLKIFNFLVSWNKTLILHQKNIHRLAIRAAHKCKYLFWMLWMVQQMCFVPFFSHVCSCMHTMSKRILSSMHSAKLPRSHC